MASQQRILQDAIDRSRGNNEIVHIEYEGNGTDLRVGLGIIYDGEIDSANENDGTIDVWGCTDEMPAGQGDMDWRLRVTLI